MAETHDADATQQTAEQAPVVEAEASHRPRLPLRRLALIALAGAALLATLWAVLRMTENQATVQRQMMDEMRDSLRQFSRDVETARARAEQTRRLAPERDNYYTLLAAGNLDLRAERIEAAANSLRAAIKADANGQLADEAHFRLAECHIKQGARDEALAEFLLVVSGYPGSPFYPKALTESSRLLMAKREYAQARRLLYQLLACRGRVSPDDSATLTQAYFRIAETYEAEADMIKSQSAPTGADLGLTARASGSRP